MTMSPTVIAWAGLLYIGKDTYRYKCCLSLRKAKSKSTRFIPVMPRHVCQNHGIVAEIYFTASRAFVCRLFLVSYLARWFRRKFLKILLPNWRGCCDLGGCTKQVCARCKFACFRRLKAALRPPTSLAAGRQNYYWRRFTLENWILMQAAFSQVASLLNFWLERVRLWNRKEKLRMWRLPIQFSSCALMKMRCCEWNVEVGAFYWTHHCRHRRHSMWTLMPAKTFHCCRQLAGALTSFAKCFKCWDVKQDDWCVFASGVFVIVESAKAVARCTFLETLPSAEEQQHRSSYRRIISAGTRIYSRNWVSSSAWTVRMVNFKQILVISGTNVRILFHLWSWLWPDFQTFGLFLKNFSPPQFGLGYSIVWSPLE